MSGYGGKVVFIDLTQGKVIKEELPESIYRSFLAELVGQFR